MHCQFMFVNKESLVLIILSYFWSSLAKHVFREGITEYKIHKYFLENYISVLAEIIFCAVRFKKYGYIIIWYIFI